MPPKIVRLKIFVERLQNALPANSHDEAYELLSNVLNTVEDQLTSIPYDPDNWQTDGRLYPPQQDSSRPVKDHPTVRRYRNLGHNTFISQNGAILISGLDAATEILMSKPGADGKDVWGVG